MTKRKVCITLDDNIIEWIEEKRGKGKRSKFINAMLQDLRDTTAEHKLVVVTENDILITVNDIEAMWIDENRKFLTRPDYIKYIVTKVIEENGN